MCMRSINEIIIHCTATPAGRSYSVDDIRRWHKERGFKDIGYHFVVALDGKICFGRPIKDVGAHCKGHNANSIGICYVGGMSSDGSLPEDTRTTAQRESLARLLRYLLELYPCSIVKGHNELSKKACPCFDVQKWLKEEGIK